jgi:hypothetical protein
VNQPQSEAELAAIRRSIQRGQPFGGDAWRQKVSRQLGLEHCRTATKTDVSTQDICYAAEPV